VALDRRESALPFALKLVLAFVGLHAARSVWLAARAASAPAPSARGFSQVLEIVLPYALYLCFDVLLATQIVGRARTAVFWGVTYFVTLALFSLGLLVVDAERWPALAPLERARELAGIGATLALAAALLTRRARRALVR
jgi:hypothetical protein